MSYHRNNRSGGGRGRNRGNFGNRDGGRGITSSSCKKGSEICRRFILGGCDFEQINGRPCRYPHLLKKIGETRGHSGPVKDVVLWNSRQQVFTCGADSCVKLWDCASWNEISTLNVLPSSNGVVIGKKSSQKSEGVVSMVLEGPFLFAGFESTYQYNPSLSVGMIRAWNLEMPQMPPFEFHTNESANHAHTMNVLSLAVATDSSGGATLFSGSADGSIKYWKLDPATNVFRCSGILEGHTRGVTRLKTTIISTMPVLASASVDSTIRLWDLATYQCIKVLSLEEGGHRDAVMDLELWANQSESFLISAGLDSEVIVWNLSPPFQQVFKETQSCQVTAICGAQDAIAQPILFIGTTDGSITIKELPTFAYKATLSTSANYGHQDAVRRIISGPHNTLFSVGNDRKMVAWQITGDIRSIESR
ncbi:unnamed protein product [Albugo candida]|uniref:C3H1-type domain-containing protein n=1 Tax=Albugo candida TaxID=65357 RepID=A0A024G3Y0_9STRA|nr:unnamed protein product [Albugo candida]|eukprot:CCI41272.1 unnamed protein product [Albugo candida]